MACEGAVLDMLGGFLRGEREREPGSTVACPMKRVAHLGSPRSSSRSSSRRWLEVSQIIDTRAGLRKEKHTACT